ncbi:MAG: hypothetical protein GTO41_24335, partial [Burkholderiales bacterium]|nr:hypothetical protein [Burkholderiales bacterium]
IDSGGTTTTVPAHEVRRINFTAEPSALTKAKVSFGEDRFNACLAELENNKETSERRVIQQEMDFYRAISAAKMALAG